MAKILPPRAEYLRAIALLRKHKLFRAANRLEALSQGILNPQPKPKPPKVTAATLIGGSGRKYRIKIALEDNEA